MRFRIDAHMHYANTFACACARGFVVVGFYCVFWRVSAACSSDWIHSSRSCGGRLRIFRSATLCSCLELGIEYSRVLVSSSLSFTGPPCGGCFYMGRFLLEKCRIMEVSRLLVIRSTGGFLICRIWGFFGGLLVQTLI